MNPTPVVPTSDQRPLLSRNVRIGLLIGIPVAFVLFLIIVFANVNSTRSALIDHGTQLTAQYQANQTELDTYHKKISEEFGIAGTKVAALDQIIADAVKGRYDKGTLATPGQPGANGALISALQEAYPNLQGADVYDRLVTEVSSGRELFKQVQQKLLDQLRVYKSYRSKGIFHNWLVGKVGYPELQARIGGTDGCPSDFVVGNACVYTGKAALNHLQLIITSGEVSQSFTSGTEAPLNLAPPTTTAK